MQSDTFKRTLAARSLSLADHLSGEFLHPTSGEAAMQIAQRRLTRWKEVLNRFQPDSLHRRLAWDHIALDEPTLLERLRPGTLKESAPLPAWLDTAWALQHCLQQGTTSSDNQGYLQRDDPIPFEHLFAPLIAQQNAQLVQQCPEWTAQLSEGARNTLCRDLLSRLSAVLGRCLEHEFSLFRVSQQQDSGTDGNTLYLTFIQNLVNGDIAPFLLKYAYATRLASLSVTQWQCAQRRFARHLSEDRAALAAQFGLPKTGPVCAVSTGLSDRHHGGLTVIRTEFADGNTVYYKPRGMALESRAADLMSQLDPGLKSMVPAVLSRDDHGWAKEVVANPGDPEPYYYQAGKVVFAAWVFAGTDLHDENVLPSSQGPVVIDAEMLASPLPLFENGPAAGKPGKSLYNRAEDNTVLRSSLLPSWESYGNDTLVQISGMSAGKQYQTGLKTSGWSQINTDRMALKSEWVCVENATQIASLPEPSDYANAVIEGFQSLVDPARALTAQPAWHNALATQLADCEVRFLVRDTSLYTSLEYAIRHPRHSLTTLDAEIEQECLASTFLSHDTCPHVWPFLEEEKRALQQGDVPHFTARANSTDWVSPDGDTVAIFSSSGVDTIRERFAELDDSNIAFQLGLIRTSLFTTREPSPSVNRTAGITDAPLQAATRIGDMLLQMAWSEGEKGRLNWAAPQSQGPNTPRTVRKLGYSMYNGLAGLGLFFAALARSTGAERFLDASKSSFANLQTLTGDWHYELDDQHGACLGRSSVLFTLDHAARLTEDTALIQIRDTLLTPLLDGTVKPNQANNMDWIAGVAGRSAALDRWLTNQDRQRSAQSLLQHFAAYDQPSLLAGWPSTPSAQPADFQSGAGHGIAGPMLRLCQLASQDSNIRDDVTIKATLDTCRRFLQSLWVAEKSNWRIAAAPESRSDIDGWAHGPYGIVLALQAHEALYGSSNPQREAVIERLYQRDLMQWDHLPMGNCGLIELWLNLGNAEQAATLAQRMLDRQRSIQRWAIPGGELMKPGMMTGLAGIGYTLLRLESGEQLPSLLTMQ